MPAPDLVVNPQLLVDQSFKGRTLPEPVARIAQQARRRSGYTGVKPMINAIRMDGNNPLDLFKRTQGIFPKYVELFKKPLKGRRMDAGEQIVFPIEMWTSGCI